MKLLQGNNIDLLKTLEDNSIDSIVTDGLIYFLDI